MSRCNRPWLWRKRIPSTTSRAIWSLSLSDKLAWRRQMKGKGDRRGCREWNNTSSPVTNSTPVFLITARSTHLQSCIEVSVQPLHDKQHSNAGATAIGVIDHWAVQVDEPLVFGQSPAEMQTSHLFLRQQRLTKVLNPWEWPRFGTLKWQNFNVCWSTRRTLQRRSPAFLWFMAVRADEH